MPCPRSCRAWRRKSGSVVHEVHQQLSGLSVVAVNLFRFAFIKKKKKKQKKQTKKIQTTQQEKKKNTKKNKKKKQKKKITKNNK
jgi:amino acid permease